MLTRRKFNFVALSLGAAGVSPAFGGEQDDTVTVQIRADETVRDVLQPIEQSNLTIERDQSDAAKDLTQRVPAGRAVPIIFYIVGAIALAKLLEMIKELYRETYYGGVLIDNRSRPTTITSDPKIPANIDTLKSALNFFK